MFRLLLDRTEQKILRLIFFFLLLCILKAAIFCLERLTDIVERNMNRLEIIWPLVKKHFEDIISNPQFTHPTYYTERAVVNLLRICVMLLVCEKVCFPVS